ncbi:MAG TPA: hypothetical protein VGN26_12985 [Armatimonadota bacterium]|jgi:flotillin
MDMNPVTTALIAVFVAVVLIPIIVTRFLTNVESGTIRLVSWLRGETKIYKGPGKAIEVPIFTVGTSIPAKAINIDLDITDQTADRDQRGTPAPIKVRVQASAIVSVGDTEELIKTAANRFFSKPEEEQQSTLTDLLSSAGRRAVNLLTHDQLFSAEPEDVARNAAVVPVGQDDGEAENDDPLAIIIKKACSRELHDLGLEFKSLNIKVVQSEVAEARRRQRAVEAQANADIVVAEQQRRAKEAQLAAERAISDNQRDLEKTRADNAALVAAAEASKQRALAEQRKAELFATQIAQANADADQARIAAQAQADSEAIHLRTVADAQAEAIRKVNEAMAAGGEAYVRLRQVEMLPQIAADVTDALKSARMFTLSGGGDGGAAAGTVSQVTDVIKTVLALQAVGQVMPVQPKAGDGSVAPEPPQPQPVRVRPGTTG